MSETAGGNAGKTRRRKGGKTAERPGDGKVKATIRLTPEADKRLSIHAAMMEMDGFGGEAHQRAPQALRCFRPRGRGRRKPLSRRRSGLGGLGAGASP